MSETHFKKTILGIAAAVFSLWASFVWAVGALTNGVPVTGLAAPAGGELRFLLDVPAGASGLNFQLSGGTGDADLYVQFGSAPTLDSFDCRPYLGGNDETCNMSNATEGVWHVLIHGYEAFSGVSLVGSYTAAPAPGSGDWNEIAKLLAGDGAIGDKFGGSVAVAEDTAVIGTLNNNGAYVYTRDASGTWSQQAKLTASDGQISYNLGWSVALAGDTAIIGDPLDRDAGVESGAAYVFTRDVSGVWSQQAKLTARDGAALAGFGNSVALAGDTAIIGAKYDDGAGVKSGAAYVFTHDGVGTWSQQAKLTASDAAASGYFGWSVALAEDTAIIGAFSQNAAYVYTRDIAGNWSEKAKLTASDATAYDYFGVSVALAGDIAIVGAYLDDAVGYASGSAYVFTRDGVGTWSEQTKLIASDGAAFGQFGTSVALAGDTAVIGAPVGVGYTSGSAYVFTRSGAEVDPIPDTVNLLL